MAWGKRLLRWDHVGGSQRTLACWRDAVWCWEQDSRSVAWECEKKQQLAAWMEMVAAGRELRRQRRAETIRARQQADRAAIARASERGRRAREALIASAAQWGGHSPDEQHWDQWRAADSRAECGSQGSVGRRQRKASAAGTCGGTVSWRAVLKARRSRLTKESLEGGETDAGFRAVGCAERRQSEDEGVVGRLVLSLCSFACVTPSL